jgi:hypothetical protein
MRLFPGFFLPLTLAALAACGDNLTFVEGAGEGTSVLPCAPNLDGTLTASELPVVLGGEARFRLANEIPVNLDGVVGADGRRRFDFAGRYGGDRFVGFGAATLAERWYAASFPGGEFVAALDASLDAEGALEGIYSRAPEGLRLHGVASRLEAPAVGKTLLVYEAPVVVLPLPLRVGSAWVATGRTTGGTLRGSPYNGTDRYEGVAAGAGELRLPELTFASVIEVRLKTTVSPSSGAPVVRRQAGFYAECFGEVARATAADNDDDASFTTAREVRRFAP